MIHTACHGCNVPCNFFQLDPLLFSYTRCYILLISSPNSWARMGAKQMTYTFGSKTFAESLEQMADYFESKAKSIRSRVPNASRNSQHVMRAEAHAYEQCAMIARNAKIEPVTAEPVAA